jgi:hypothetical protein
MYKNKLKDLQLGNLIFIEADKIKIKVKIYFKLIIVTQDVT